MMFYQGDIYYCFDRGKSTNHRVLIVSREELNRGNYVVTVAFTSKRLKDRKELPNCVFFPAGSQTGLDEDCVMQGESITMTPWTELDVHSGLLGRVEEDKMEEVIAAIGDVMAASCFRN